MSSSARTTGMPTRTTTPLSAMPGTGAAAVMAMPMSTPATEATTSKPSRR